MRLFEIELMLKSETKMSRRQWIKTLCGLNYCADGTFDLEC